MPARAELGPRVVSKVARPHIPFTCLAYFINYLDRTATLDNAKILRIYHDR